LAGPSSWCGDRNALLVGADGEVDLCLDLPQPVVGIEWIIQVVEGGGLRADEPLDLLRDVLVWWAIAVLTVATVLHGFRHPLHQLSLNIHYVHQVGWWRWRLLWLRLVLF
jgi:hypothetical protein